MRFKIAFGRASDDLFFVTTRLDSAMLLEIPARSKVTTFAHEDEFLKLLVMADLSDEETASLAAGVLLSVARPTVPPQWIDADLTRREMQSLHLYGLPGTHGTAADCELSGSNDLYLVAARSGSLPQFYDLLMQAPMPIALLVGPEHRFSFMNARWLQLLCIESATTVVGRTVLEAFPELGPQRALEVMDRVYRKGIPHIGTECRSSFRRESSGEIEEGYFNTVCQPILNAFGEIAGIMIQAIDVTDIALARAVQGAREAQLYRQWAELEAIYRNAPIGLLLLEPKEFRILKLNQRQAEIIGASISELLGMPLLAAGHELVGVREMLEAVARGESFTNRVFEGRLAASPDTIRRWLVSVAPVYSAKGKVEAITLVSQEVPGESLAEIEFQAEPRSASRRAGGARVNAAV